ncbi:sulfatase-like hydrolase/transferase [Moraxella canis]|uniref:sulfatase-like hydrolase/transferase n=1 Tax=Moraxella canis TaxID=90239 RepID=UPI000668FB22|nr:sulfatase-like hydrolase/transferase [Moraxella canis]
MKKHQLALALAMLMSGLPSHASATSYDSMPNVLVIMADDLGWSDITPYGSEIDTPYLDELAKQGVSFSNFFCFAFFVTVSCDVFDGYRST